MGVILVILALAAPAAWGAYVLLTWPIYNWCPNCQRKDLMVGGCLLHPEAYCPTCGTRLVRRKPPEYRCPNGHKLPYKPSFWLKYCPVCGARLDSGEEAK